MLFFFLFLTQFTYNMVHSCEPQTQRYKAQRYKGMALYHVISTSSEQQPVYETLLKWSCSDECKYTCMWITVDAFQRDGMDIPQFYGKVSNVETREAQWLSGRVLDSRPRGREFEPHRRCGP